MKFETTPAGAGAKIESISSVDKTMLEILHGLDAYDFKAADIIAKWEALPLMERTKVPNLLRLAQVANQLKNDRWYNSPQTAKDLLDYISSCNDSYFIKRRIESIEHDPENWDKVKQDLNDPKIESLGLRPSYLESGKINSNLTPDEHVKRSTYSKLDENYGVVYSPYSHLIHYYSPPLNVYGQADSFINLARGEKAELEDILAAEGFDLEAIEADRGAELVEVYRALIDPPMRRLIENDLDFKLPDLNIRTQIQLLDFISRRSEAEVDRVKNLKHQFGLDGLKTFLACEYGEDLGKLVLELGDKLEPVEAEEIFRLYSQMTNSVQVLAKQLRGNEHITQSKLPTRLKDRLPFELSEAMMRRTKDIFIAANDITHDEIKDLTMADVRDAFAGLAKFMSILESAAGEDKYIFKQEQGEKNNFKYLILDPETREEYRLKIFIRPEAEAKAQARINLELSFDTAHPNQRLKQAFNQKTVYLKDKKTVEESVLRMAIDRDDFGGEERVSLDLGRNSREGEGYNRSGDVLGRLLDAASKSEDGHHNFASFSSDLGKTDNFKELAEILRQALASLEPGSRQVA